MDSSTALAEQSTPRDIYYQDKSNSLVQSIPVVYDTRFNQAFTTLNGGQQSLFIPPSNGINKVMIVLEFLPSDLLFLALGTTGLGSYALPRGWGYLALQTLSWRISGSQQYFATALQVLASNLRKCRTKTQRDAILSLGGNACLTASDFAKPQRAYIPMSFFTTPSNDGLDVPVASDILGSQIQLTCVLNSPSAYFKANPAWGATPLPALPSALSAGNWTVEQLSMMDRGMSLASRPGVNMDTETYVQAIRSFDQQELTVSLENKADVQTVNINGFMSGQVRGLQVYLTTTSALNPATLAVDANGVASDTQWYVPDAVRCIFAGQIYADYQNGSSVAWNLIDGTAPNLIDNAYLAGVAPVAPATTGTWATPLPQSSQWVSLPFSQPTHNDYEADMMVSGLRITNGSVQLQVRVPFQPSYPGGVSWTLHCIPILNSAIAYSRGSATLLIG